MTLILLTVKCSDTYEQVFQVTSVYVCENEEMGLNIGHVLVIQSNSCTIHTLKHTHFNI